MFLLVRLYSIKTIRAKVVVSILTRPSSSRREAKRVIACNDFVLLLFILLIR